MPIRHLFSYSRLLLLTVILFITVAACGCLFDFDHSGSPRSVIPSTLADIAGLWSGGIEGLSIQWINGKNEYSILDTVVIAFDSLGHGRGLNHTTMDSCWVNLKVVDQWAYHGTGEFDSLFTKWELNLHIDPFGRGEPDMLRGHLLFSPKPTSDYMTIRLHPHSRPSLSPLP